MSTTPALIALFVAVAIVMTAAGPWRFRNRKEEATSNNQKQLKPSEVSDWLIRHVGWLVRRNECVEDKLNRILAGETRLHQQIGSEADADERRDRIIMSALDDAMATLEANTTSIDGAAESAEAAFTRIAALIADLRAGTTDQATIDKINALSQALGSHAASLGAAVDASPT